jgi:energy-coupling factor transport system ATP-binding protein
MLNGLIKPASGQVFYNGTDIFSKPKELRQLRFNVGMVFQYPEYQLFAETVYDDIAFGPKNMGLSGDDLDEAVRNAARFAGLKEELLTASPFDLSGGEKRRAAIAGVIAMNPDVLIMDEPTAGLDPVGRDVILAQIHSYHKQCGNTVLLVSHSMEDVARLCEKVLVMNESKAVMFDETKKVFAQAEMLNQMGLRLPQITQITQALRKNGYAIPPDILTVEEAVEMIKSI